MGGLKLFVPFLGSGYKKAELGTAEPQLII